MSVFVISDPHLSFSCDKPMDVFGVRWNNHYEKIRDNWEKTVGDNDTVVIPGDISWGMSLDEARLDLEYIHSLPGKKIIGRGNHDYWWSTASKMNRFVAEYNLNSISFLYNNAFLCDNIIACGTRLWMYDISTKDEDERILRRETNRLKMSLDLAKSLKQQNPNAEIVAFTHYPVAFGDFVNADAISLMKEYEVSKIYYGHLHGVADSQLEKEICGLKHALCACDYLDFCPIIAD